MGSSSPPWCYISCPSHYAFHTISNSWCQATRVLSTANGSTATWGIFRVSLIRFQPTFRVNTERAFITCLVLRKSKVQIPDLRAFHLDWSFSLLPQFRPGKCTDESQTSLVLNSLNRLPWRHRLQATMFDLATRWRCAISFTSRKLYSRSGYRSWHPLDKRLWTGENTALAGNRNLTVQLVRHRYTD
jgi:hypothetical protein